MKNYITLTYWAFVVLWKEKTILPMDRIRLWKKSLNLFVCFLAFTDRERPKQQLRGAMISAILSAIYDYETDWVRIKNIEDSIYLRLLQKYAFHSLAYEEAYRLFVTDWEGKLSEHGLERGSSALVFYHSLINSRWMNTYSINDITSNGRLLQIIDDLLDLEEDRKNGDINCFLTDKSKIYMLESKNFLKSKFFKTLEKQCIVYYLLQFECLRIANKQENIRPTRSELFHLLRPLTGVYAFVVTIIGFRFFSLPWIPAILSGFTFIGIAWSTMVWNDLMDRERDLEKKKTLAFLHPYLVYKIWWQINKPTIFLLLISTMLHWQIGIFGLSMWFLSIWYSVITPKYPYNNLLVAFCSASPVLTGMIYAEIFNWKVLLVFLILFSTIKVMELVKDIQDMNGDIGYKNTLPVRKGKVRAVIIAILLCCFPIAGTLIYPGKIIILSTLLFLSIVWSLAFSIKYSRAIYLTETCGDIFVALFLLIVLSTQ